MKTTYCGIFLGWTISNKKASIKFVLNKDIFFIGNNIENQKL